MNSGRSRRLGNSSAVPTTTLKLINATHLGAVWRIEDSCPPGITAPDVEALCFQENDRLTEWRARSQAQKDSLVESLKARDGGADSSLPVEYRGWLYFDRWAKGDDHVQHCRMCPGTQTDQSEKAPERPVELLFDENALARNRPHFDIGDWGISPCGELVAWTADVTGDEIHRLFVKHVATGDIVDVSPTICDAEFEWCETERATLAYTVIDDDGRASIVKCHTVGDPGWDDDRVIYLETDDAWSVGVFKSRCERTLFIQTDCFDANETWHVSAAAPCESLNLVTPREEGLEYHVDRQGELFVIMASIGDGDEFSVYECDVKAPARNGWRLLRRPDPGTTIESVEPFEKYRLTTLRRGARVRVEISPGFQGGVTRIVAPDHPMGGVTLDDNPNFSTTRFRFSFVSPIDGERIAEVDPDSGEHKTLWEENPGDDYDASRYSTERIWASGFDGELIPVSLVWRRDRLKVGGQACLLRVYGAYEEIEDLELDTDRLGLIDAGMIYAIAHVRGGGEKGRVWYESGRGEHKVNSTRDLLAVVDHLERTGRVRPGAVVAHTESAGGIVVASALNEAPERFAGAICEVPFVDMINSLLDEELPTTLADRDEFGDPTDPAELGHILELSPVEGVGRKPYPPVLLTVGVNDARVPAREGLRWAAAIRRRSTSDAPVLVIADVDSGHHGPSGRAREISRIAELHAFALGCAGLD